MGYLRDMFASSIPPTQAEIDAFVRAASKDTYDFKAVKKFSRRHPKHLNKLSTNDMTALMAATDGGLADCVKHLLDRDVDTKVKQSESPFRTASQFSLVTPNYSQEISNMLFNKQYDGADIQNVQSESLKTDRPMSGPIKKALWNIIKMGG